MSTNAPGKIRLSSLDAAEFEDLHQEALKRSPEYASGYATREAVIEAGEQAVLSAGKMIREARLAQGLKQEELAERSGVAQSKISDIERGVGRYGPGAATLGRLCAALGGELNLSSRAEPTAVEPASLASVAEQAAGVLQAMSAGDILDCVQVSDSDRLAASAATTELPGEMTVSVALNDVVVSSVQLHAPAAERSTTDNPVRHRATVSSSGTGKKH